MKNQELEKGILELAQKRMFTMKIVDSDAFLDMPATTQCLYFHLNMRADDDGFIGNPKRIMKITGASEDDLRLLIAKRFVLTFEDGVIVIKHWRMHNTLSRDRYTETSYIDEKRMLLLKENGSYSLASGNVIDDTKLIERSNRQTHNRRNKDATKAHAEKDIGLDKDIDIDKDKDTDIDIDKDTDKDKDKDKAIDKEKKKDAGTAKSDVRSFGTHKNIMLTSEQYNELESRCRSVGLSLESYISKLSQWLFTKGRHCTDPYRIISGWLDNDSKRKTAAKPKEKQGCDLSWYDDFAMNFDLSKFF